MKVYKVKFIVGETCNVGSVVEFSPATREARVRFPDVANVFHRFDKLGLETVTVICLFVVLFIFKVLLCNLVVTVNFRIIPRIIIDNCTLLLCI